MRSITLVAVLLGCASPTLAAKDVSCKLVHQELANAQKRQWTPAINRQLNGKLDSINQVFELSGWFIVFVDAKGADPPFLFYHGNPVKTHYITMWSGAAMRSEQAEIKNWVLKNAPGIPVNLASCFAWQVTQRQDINSDLGR